MKREGIDMFVSFALYMYFNHAKKISNILKSREK